MTKTTLKELPPMNNSCIELWENFFTEKQSDQYFTQLQKDIEWKQESMMLYGKPVNFARLTAWYGEKGKPYTFSGITLHPNDWNEMPLLLDIKKQIEFQSYGTIFNSVLLNKYKDGNSHISWHSDQEKELGRNPVIASVTFGCERTFKMRRYDDKSEVHNIILTHGSLLVMSGETQHYWQHMIPKQKINTNDTMSMFGSEIQNGTERINLTFRDIVK